MEVNRAALFMAINNPRFIEAAWSRGIDGAILDFEDAVGEPHKVDARKLPGEVYPQITKASAIIQVRINHTYWAADLEAVVWPGLSGILYPKTESAEEVRLLDAKITELERLRGMRPGSVGIQPLIESARGVINSFEIAGASPRISSFGGGGGIGVDVGRDLAVEIVTGFPRAVGEYGAEGELAARALGMVVAGGARVGQGPGGDVVSGNTAFDEAAANRKSGFYTGRLCLHPNRVDPMVRGLTPPEEEVEEAEQVLLRFEELDNRGEVEGQLNGKTVDKWEAERARKLLEWADACAKKDRDKAAAMERNLAAAKGA